MPRDGCRMQCEFEGVEKYLADEEGEMPDVLPNPDTHLCTLGKDSDTAVITVKDDEPAR